MTNDINFNELLLVQSVKMEINILELQTIKSYLCLVNQELIDKSTLRNQNTKTDKQL